MAPPRNQPRGSDSGEASVSSRRDRQPGGGVGKPPKPPKKNPLGDFVPTWDPSTGKLKPAGNDLLDLGNRDANRQREQRNNREILRRQRLLRAHGFNNIVVDGVWGPMSQRAWNRYLRGQGASVLSPRNARDRDQLAVTGPTPAEIKAQRQRDLLESRRIRVKQQEAKRARVKARADLIRSNPAAARTMSIHELSEVLRDPVMNMTADKRPAARAVQEFLRGHGRQVKRTGEFDRQTHDAFQAYAKVLEKNETAKRLEAIKSDLYLRAGVRPGDKPEWFPLPQGVPSPAELDKMFQEGGFTAKMTLEALLRRSVTSFSGFDQARHRQLRAAAMQLQPFLLSERLSSSTDILGVMGSIFGVSDLASRKDLSHLPLWKQQWELGRRSRMNQLAIENEKQLGVLRAQAMALAESTSPDDFKAKMSSYLRVEEVKHQRRQMEAAQHKPFWGKALDTVLAPGQWGRTALVYDAMRVSQYLSGQSEGERDIRWEDAAVVLGKDPDTLPNYDGLAESANGVLRFGFELVADPLNFVTPFRTASTFIRAGTRGQHWGTYALRAADQLNTKGLRRQVATGDHIWSKALVYNRGMWSKSSALGKVDDFVFRGHAVHDTKGWEKISAATAKFTQTREQAFAKVQERLQYQIRHGFRPPKEKNARKGWKGKTPKSIDAVDEARVDLRHRVETYTEFDKLVNELTSKHISLMVDSGRLTLANSGASLAANFAEKFRVVAAHQLATDVADGVLDARGVPELRELIDQAVRANDSEHLAIYQGQLDLAVAEAVAEYHSFVARVGVYIEGGVGDKDVAKQLLDRTLSKMDDMENLLFPILQDIVEDNADVAFAQANKQAADVAATGARESVSHPLWDEAGLWAGRQGEEATELRRLGRDAFDESNLTSVRNPAHGIAHGWDEASEAVEGELRRRLPRVYNYVARNLVGGTLGDFNMADEVERIRQDIFKSWEQRTDGSWYDTRDTIEVNALYAKAHKSAYDTMAGRISQAQADGSLATDGFGVLASPILLAPANAFDDDLWKIAWMMGGRFRTPPPSQAFQHPTRRSFRQEVDFGLPPEERLDAFRVDSARMEDFSESLATAKIRVSEATDELLAGELQREGLYWQALSRSQSRYMKALYHSLNAATKVWVFATLALKFGWVVRNQLDNLAKSIIASVRDPRMLFLGATRPGGGVKSVFQLGLIHPLRGVVLFFDRLFGTNALAAFDGILDQIWTISSDALGRLFGAHGLPAVPQAALDGARFSRQVTGMKGRSPNPIRVTVGDYERADELAPKSLLKKESRRDKKLSAESSESAWERLGWKMRYGKADVMWELFGDRPENYFKRVIYRSEYQKGLREIGAAQPELSDIEAQILAHERAWDKVTETLFDYGQISVAEDNLRVFFPFIQFWRKNTGFWVKNLATKPWLDNAILQFDQERRESHRDLPEWMQRYLHVEEIVDAAAVVPGLDLVVDAMLPDNMMLDPFSFTSAAPLQRAWRDYAYGSNDLLSDQDKGMAIIGPLLDAMSDYGLGLSPFWRKPLEAANIASDRSWQSMFPQTQLAVAMSRKFLTDEQAFKIADWERVFTLWLGKAPSDQLADNFDFYVNQEVAGQVVRGDEPDRDKAEATIRATFFTQQAWGYFGGAYWRRATPEDIYMSKLQDNVMTGEREFDDLSDKEKSLLKLWSIRRMDPESMYRYLDLLPMVEAFYRTANEEEKAEILRENPGLIEYVQVRPPRKTMGSRWIQNVQKHAQTARFFEALKIIEKLDPDGAIESVTVDGMEMRPASIRSAAYDIFVSPSLREFWQVNDTKQQIRDRMVKGEVHRYYRDLNESYFAIPSTDYDARDGFLDNNPELVQYWNRHNNASEDAESILQAANSSLREQYFNIVESKGWDAAAPLLKRHPFMFEDTKSADKIDLETGTWKFGGTGKGKWSAARRAEFLRVKPKLSWFFDVLMKRVGEKKAWAWLNDSETEGAKMMRDYLRKYGKHSAHAMAYLKAKAWLKLYFGMDDEARRAWLNGDSEGAKIVREYFKKWAGKDGLSQHAKDYLDAKSELSYYFGLDKQERRDWLKSDDPRAKKVLSYFKKYGKAHNYEKIFKKYPQLVGGTPEQRKRLEFWRQFYNLAPDQRPDFVHNNAEDSGVFIYGEFGEQERHDEHMEYVRRAVGLGLNRRQAAYLYVKPLLDFFQTLEDDEKPLFLRANPQLQNYFDRYVTDSVTGNKKLDVAVEQYFQLPPDSISRSQFLKAHPEVQDWFDSRSSPAERAMRNLLEQYFSIRAPSQRKEYLAAHPEVSAFFDQRREEKSNEASIYQAFDATDPRLAPFYSVAQDLERSAEEMRQRLKRQAYESLWEGGGFETRRERRPAEAA